MRRNYIGTVDYIVYIQLQLQSGAGCGQEMKANPEKWLAGQAASSWTGPDWGEK